MSDFGIKTGVACIFKSYGPCDNYSEGSGQVVCSLFRKAINYPKEDFVVGADRSIERYLVYIDDLIDALLLIENEITKKFITLNLGRKRSIAIREFDEKIIRI